jgi:Holliday junction resolvase-like predicted endonuclease
MTVGMLRRCLAVVGVDLDLAVRGDRARFDRLLDERHAALETRWAAYLRRLGWRVWVERSFSHFGERGRVDLLCWHAPTPTLAIVEIKTELADIQDLLGSLDTKVRLATTLAAELDLPRPALAVPILVLEESMTMRRQVARLAALFEQYELRGREARSWLRNPHGAPTGILVFSAANASRTREVAGQRIRVRGASNHSGRA